MVKPQFVLNKVTHEQEWQDWVQSIMQECRMLLWTLDMDTGLLILPLPSVSHEDEIRMLC